MTRNGNEHENENEWDVDEPGDSSSYGEVRINNGANGNGYGHIRAEQWGTEAQDRMDAESEHMNESVIVSFVPGAIRSFHFNAQNPA